MEQLTIKEDDVLVFKVTEVVPDMLMREYYAGVNYWMEKFYPKNPHIILDSRMDLSVIKADKIRKHIPFKNKLRKRLTSV